MKEVKIHKDDSTKFRCEIVDSPTPTPGPGQLLIKVVVSGTNPKDWKIPLVLPQLPPEGLNTGDDIAGTVAAVGAGVTEFKVGDRVASFHEMMTPHGSFAEYAIGRATTTFHLPAATTFEEAATIPLAAMTAAVGLYARLGLPEPWAKTHPAYEKTGGGVIVYGAASAVGAFAIKLLARADVHPILAVAGRGIPFVESLLDRAKGDTVVDYRAPNDRVIQALKAAIPAGQACHYAYDAVSEHDSYQNICAALAPRGRITLVLPGKKYDEIPASVHQSLTTVGAVHGKPDDLSDLGFAWFRLFGLGLHQGWFTGHPHQVLPGGLAAVDTGLRNLMDAKASAVKYVYRVEDTEGAERGSGSKM